MKFLDNVGITYCISQLKSYINTKIEDLKTLLSTDIDDKQDKLTAGDNITIDSNNKISATVSKGEKGEDGYTPIKGVDYFTEADKAEIVTSVLEAIPVVGGEEY